MIKHRWHRWRERDLFSVRLAGDMHLCPIEFFFDPVEGVVTDFSTSPEFGESATFGQDGVKLDVR
jgi:hypothetical protein